MEGDEGNAEYAANQGAGIIAAGQYAQGMGIIPEENA